MLVTIFYHVSEFCKELEKDANHLKLGDTKKRERERSLELSEIMTIMIYYHYSGYKTFKHYYCNYVLKHLTGEFKRLVSYNRFVELMKEAVLALALFLKIQTRGVCTGISFIDSTSLKVCHNRRIYSHKVFKELAQRGKTSVDWFFGFKLHLIINHLGEIINFNITTGNVADNNRDSLKEITSVVFGKLFGDKGYIIASELFQDLYSRNIHLITKLHSNMKNKLMDIWDKMLLKKRGIVDSVIGLLKSDYSLEHTRHRSTVNFLASILSSLVAYSFRQKKPSISREKTLLSLPS